MKVFCYTFGCKVNQYETENIKERLESSGSIIVSSHLDADVCIVNSCTVTSEADKKCRQLLHKIRHENPGCILVCAGCMTQAHKNIADKLPECDIIAGAQNKTLIPDLIDEFMNTGRRIVAVEEHKYHEQMENMSNKASDDRTRAYIKIQDGCDMHCSYCIIPNARGHIRSKPLSVIKTEAVDLIRSGHREIILTGINLNCYGRENAGALRLTDVIEMLDGIDDTFRIRLSSLEPELITDEDIIRWKKCGKLCPQFHLSLQSGCKNTLKAMNRRYTPDEYAGICEKLRTAFPGCAITTDIMVGFPGETEEDHLESIAFAEKLGFAEAHIFPYSRRPDTPADKLPGQIDGVTKHRRAAEMGSACGKTRQAYLDGLTGSVQRVLFEKETCPEYHQGHSDNYIPVRIERNSDASLRRCFRDVLITGNDGKYCYGSGAWEDIKE